MLANDVHVCDSLQSTSLIHIYASLESLLDQTKNDSDL